MTPFLWPLLALTLGHVFSNAVRTLPAVAADVLARDLDVSAQQLAAITGAFPAARLDLQCAVAAALDATPALAVEEALRAGWAIARRRDAAAGATLEGPHRADLLFTHAPKGLPASLCSTGEQKALLVAVGARVVEGRGSRVKFELGGEVETFHRPHPAKEAKRYQVRAARGFLRRIGVEP